LVELERISYYILLRFCHLFVFEAKDKSSVAKQGWVGIQVSSPLFFIIIFIFKSSLATCYHSLYFVLDWDTRNLTSARITETRNK